MNNLNPLYEFSKFRGISGKFVDNGFNLIDLLTNRNIREIIESLLKPSKKFYRVGNIVKDGYVEGKWVTRQQMHDIIKEILNDPTKMYLIRNHPSNLRSYVCNIIASLPSNV